MRERVKIKDGVEPKPFWETKTLEEMTAAEWESLCDGCGRCCLNKLEDEDTGEIVLTRLACALLDIGKCRCSDYANRFDKMPDCINLTPEKVRTLKWLPATCGYRRPGNRAPSGNFGARLRAFGEGRAGRQLRPVYHFRLRGRRELSLSPPFDER